jgi:transposase-like protein
MSERQRRNFSPEEKMKFLREHLKSKKAVSDICEQYGLHPTVFHGWIDELLEKGRKAFEKGA